MKMLSTLILSTVVLTAMSTVAFAQEVASDAGPTAASKEKASCCSKDKPSCCSEGEATCCTKEAMAKLPKMSYRVGDEATCCSSSAASLAESKKAPIHYVVGDDTYETKQAAYTSLIAKTEAMVEEFVTPCKCEVSGVTSIAGTKCQCPVKAGETAEMVQNAVKGIQMTYAVGEETCGCPNKAKMMAEAAGTETSYVVDGEKTSCEMTARLNLARAKYRAAVAAMSVEEKPADAADVSGT